MARGEKRPQTESVRYKQRIRQSMGPSFPYAKSVLISWGLIVATMLLAAALSDPKSGLTERPILALSILSGLPFAILTVFYIEFRRKNRGKQRSSSHHEY
jgi:hypothetical protein